MRGDSLGSCRCTHSGAALPCRRARRDPYRDKPHFPYGGSGFTYYSHQVSWFFGVSVSGFYLRTGSYSPAGSPRIGLLGVSRRCGYRSRHCSRFDLIAMEGGSEDAMQGDSKRVSLEDLRVKMAEFAKERNWDEYHSPRNLLLAMVGEVGELSEIFQWKGEVPKGLPDWNSAEKEHLGEELSDVLLYLVRLADMCGIDLGDAALDKIKKNALKYPVGQCKGSSKKYTQYKDGN